MGQRVDSHCIKDSKGQTHSVVLVKDIIKSMIPDAFDKDGHFKYYGLVDESSKFKGYFNLAYNDDNPVTALGYNNLDDWNSANSADYLNVLKVAAPSNYDEVYQIILDTGRSVCNLEADFNDDYNLNRLLIELPGNASQDHIYAQINNAKLTFESANIDYQSGNDTIDIYNNPCCDCCHLCGL